MILTPVTEKIRQEYKSQINHGANEHVLLTLQKLPSDNSTSFPAVNFVELFATANINIKPSAFLLGKRYQSIM